jgi:hypothetical protein
MPTPYEDLYAGVKAMMADVNTAASHNVTQAASNYGTDFRVPSGHSVYQVQIRPRTDYSRATVRYPRCDVVVAIHHYVSSFANEEAFLYATMSTVADTLLDVTKWQAESGIFSLDPDETPEVSDGARTGNVITFEVTATALMTAV